MVKQKIAVLGIAAVLLTVTACQAGPSVDAAPENADDVLEVVATTGMIADVAQNIGGERVNVTALMGPGIDPHLYQATERDVELLQAAEVIFYNGLNLEARLAEVLEQIEQVQGTPVVAVGESIPTDVVMMESGDVPDPHIWMDVALWRMAAEQIRDALIAADPDGEAIYTANAEAYLAEMDALDAAIRQSVASIPQGQRRLVTAHDAFQYYSRAYDIEVFAPQGISTEAEASVADIQAAVDYVVDNEVPAIFFESSIPIDTVEAIIAGAEADGHSVVIGGELYADAMGDPGTPAGTYLGMLRANTEAIVTALGGSMAAE